MREYTLNIGDVKTFDSPVTLTCYGLGSCVGLFLQDRTKGISGGAHILLPGKTEHIKGFNVWSDVTHAFEKLIAEFSIKGSTLNSLRAKITGGANVLNSSVNTGERNVESVLEQLSQRRIYLAASEVGGNISRTARFVSTTGAMLVKNAENNFYKVL